jgi:hypothetical protein
MSWHWSLAVHTTGFDPMHVSPWQRSVWVHAFPSSQDWPFGITVAVVVAGPETQPATVTVTE